MVLSTGIRRTPRSAVTGRLMLTCASLKGDARERLKTLEEKTRIWLSPRRCSITAGSLNYSTVYSLMEEGFEDEGRRSVASRESSFRWPRHDSPIWRFARARSCHARIFGRRVTSPKKVSESVASSLEGSALFFGGTSNARQHSCFANC